MRIVHIYEAKSLNKVNEVIRNYNPKNIPILTTQINHFKSDDSAKIKLTINGNENDVTNLVNLLKKSV